MKKTLAIVLALVMVLAMIPAMSADTVKTETYTDKSYNLVLDSVVGSAEKYTNEAAKEIDANSVTYEYEFEKEIADVTGRWTEDTKMAILSIRGFEILANDAKDIEITIDGKKLDVDATAAAVKGARVGWFVENKGGENENEQCGIVNFPLELTKAGYTDTFVVTATYKGEEVIKTETAKVSVKLVNKSSYKGEETAVITNIAATNKLGKANVYIVGDKLYVDSVDAKVTGDDAGAVEFKVTYADEVNAPFTVITYASDPVVWNGSAYVENDAHITLSKNQAAAEEEKLSSSAATYILDNSADGQKIKFVLETKAADYETKAYTVKLRYNIKEEDPKGIYFAETTKTIGKDQVYTPVVLGVKTGAQVAATLNVPANTDTQVVDIINDGKSVIGTREGVAYITAEYTPFGYNADNKYTSSSMKIVVTSVNSLPPVEPAAEVYYVTCRALNVRAGAGTSYKKVDLIHRGDAVKVVETTNGWAKLDDGTWVCAKYIAK